ncbi:MAG: hypothetical protein V4681_02480 [Patescibacteria group bacterium]
MSENNRSSREELRRRAEEIAAEVSAMSDEEVATYIKENGLEKFINQEHTDQLLRDALVTRRNHP